MNFELLQERAMEEMVAKRQAAIDEFKIDELDWSIDQKSGVIKFHRDVDVVASAPVQVVGTYHPMEGNWLWAWGNPSIQSQIAEHAQSVREYGTKQSIKELTETPHHCTEADCWRFTALACHLASANGVYKGPTGGPLVFMTYGEVTLAETAAVPAAPVPSATAPIGNGADGN